MLDLFLLEVRERLKPLSNLTKKSNPYPSPIKNSPSDVFGKHRLPRSGPKHPMRPGLERAKRTLAFLIKCRGGLRGG